MNPLHLVEQLDRSGVVLTANGDKLAWDAPKGAVSPDLLVSMKDAKPILLALVRNDWYAAAIAMIDALDDPDRRADLLFQFNERAGICEYSGNLPRHEAERVALDQVISLLDQRQSNSPPDKAAGASSDPSPCRNTPDTPECGKSNVRPPAVDSGLPDTGKRGGA